MAFLPSSILIYRVLNLVNSIWRVQTWIYNFKNEVEILFFSTSSSSFLLYWIDTLSASQILMVPLLLDEVDMIEK